MSDHGNLTVLLVSISYFVWATWARWRYIARPNRSSLIADLSDLEALSARNNTSVPTQAQQGSKDAIKRLLGPSLPSQKKSVEQMLRKPGLRNDSIWSGELEEEALGKIMAAQAYVPNLLSDDEVVARLIVARGWLNEYGDKAEYVALGQEIDAALGKPAVPASVVPQSNRLLRHVAAFQQSQPPSPEKAVEAASHNRALLGQALAQTYVRPGSPAELIWHRKTALVLVAGLTAVVLLASFVNADFILLFGAFGGLLQRLWQFVYQRDDQNSSSPLYWSTLFLAPVAGALAAVGGLSVISFLNITNVFGKSVTQHIGFHHGVIGYVGAANLGVAFLLGFSAQLLGDLATRSTTAVSTKTSV